MKRFIQFLILSCVLLTTGCRDEFNVPGYKLGDGVPVPIHYSVAPQVMITENGSEIEPTTYAIGNIETDVKNVWVFQFEGTTDNSKLVGDPLYFDLTNPDGGNTFSGVIKLLSTVNTHRLVFIANTNNPAYSWGMMGGASDLATLKKKGMEITSTGISTRENMPMACFLDTKVSTEEIATGLTLEFRHNLAKMEFELTLPSTVTDGIEIKSVQLRNIPSDVHWCEGAVDFPDPSTIHPGNEVKRIDYDIVTDPALLPKKGESKTFLWYVPRNRQGETSNTVESQKNLEANAMATYIEIMAVDQEENEIRYRLYPGANMINNFNIDSHHHYRIPLSIGGVGDPDVDSRVDNLSKVVFGKANAYILNPSASGSGTRMFYIPIARVNDFWADPIYQIYGTDPAKAFTESTKWVCELVWHNNPNLYEPNAATKSNSKLTLHKTSGVGISNAYLQVRLPVTAEEGSLLVGLYKADDSGNKTGDCMWTWHLWVTNYDPDVPVIIDEKRHVYAVPNGQVERYGGSMWGYNNDTNYEGWNPTPTFNAPYAQTVMMDRYLGIRATDMDAVHQDYRNPALLYQFGRTQPMPAPAYAVYDKDNQRVMEPLSKNKTEYSKIIELPLSSGATMVEAIAKPDYFYNVAYGDADAGWITATREFPNFGKTDAPRLIWNDLRKSLNSPDRNEKSLFDPCPLGWKLPTTVLSTQGTATSFYGDFRDETTAKERPGLERDINGVLAFRYWPYKASPSGGYPVEGKITYPLFPGFSTTLKLFQSTSNNSEVWLNTNKRVMRLALRTYPHTATQRTHVPNLVRCIKE